MKTFIALSLVLCHLTASHAFRCEEAPIINQPRNIDAGLGMLVGVTSDFQATMLNHNSWNSVGSNLKDVSLGPAGFWGVDKENNVNKMSGSKFEAASGFKMHMVAAGGDGFVLGIRASDNVTYCLTSSRASAFTGGVGSLTWVSKTNPMKQISCGKNYCYGVNSVNEPYVLRRITGSSCSSHSWYKIPGSARMKMVKVGEDGKVFGVTPDGRVCERTRVTTSYAQGSSWQDHTMCMPIDQLAYNMGNLWVVGHSGLTLVCK